MIIIIVIEMQKPSIKVITFLAGQFLGWAVSGGSCTAFPVLHRVPSPAPRPFLSATSIPFWEVQN